MSTTRPQGWSQKPLTAQEELAALILQRGNLERQHRDAMASLEGKIRQARAHAGSNPDGPALGLTRPVRLNKAQDNRPVQNNQTGVTCVACQQDPCKCHEYKRDAGMGGLRYGDDPGRSGPTA